MAKVSQLPVLPIGTTTDGTVAALALLRAAGQYTAMTAANNRCTAGFGVTNGSEEFILTAAHCGYPNQAWDNGNHSRNIGRVSHEWTSRDVMLIRTDANKYMWDGHQTIAAQQWTKTVVGWGKVAAVVAGIILAI